MDNRRKIPERLHYLRQFRDLVVKLYERFVINRYLSTDGLQVPVCWVDTSDILDPVGKHCLSRCTHNKDLMSFLQGSNNYFYWKLAGWMEEFLLTEYEIIHDVFYQNIDFSSESAALADVKRKLDPEYSDVKAQTKRLHRLARDYIQTGISIRSTEIKELLVKHQCTFNQKHKTNLDVLGNFRN